MTKPVKTVKPAQKTIAEVIVEHAHDPSGTNGGGILATCICGTPYDWMPDHLQERILTECFPHLSEVHRDLIEKNPSPFFTRRYLLEYFHASENQQEELWDFIAEHTASTSKGVRRTIKWLKEILIKHDL
jgi:hypothetical protein